MSVKIGKEQIYITEFEKVSEKLNLKKNSSCSFTISEIFSPEKADELASSIASCLSLSGKESKISFCLSSEFAFLNTIPIDSNLSEEELNEHLLWEVSQYFPDKSVQNFVIKGYKFKDAEVRKILLAAVRKDLVSFLKLVADRLNLKLKIIDIDHFAVESCLVGKVTSSQQKYLYKNFFLVGLKDGRVDISVFKNYAFRRYFYYLLPNVQSDLRYFIAKLLSENVLAEFEKFIFYGETLDEGKADFIAGMLKDKFLALNPFSLPLFEDAKLESKYLSRFAPNVGLTLRMLWSE